MAMLEELRDLDDIKTAIFNAVEASRSPAYDPIDSFADLEEDALPTPIGTWKLIREALECMPDDAVRALCKLEGL